MCQGRALRSAWFDCSELYHSRFEIANQQVASLEGARWPFIRSRTPLVIRAPAAAHGARP